MTRLGAHDTHGYAEIRDALAVGKYVYIQAEEDGQRFRIYQFKVAKGVAIGKALSSGTWYPVVAYEITA